MLGKKLLFFKLYLNTMCFRHMQLHGIMKIITIIKMTYKNMKESKLKGC